VYALIWYPEPDLHLVKGARVFGGSITRRQAEREATRPTKHDSPLVPVLATVEDGKVIDFEVITMDKHAEHEALETKEEEEREEREENPSRTRDRIMARMRRLPTSGQKLEALISQLENKLARRDDSCSACFTLLAKLRKVAGARRPNVNDLAEVVVEIGDHLKVHQLKYQAATHTLKEGGGPAPKVPDKVYQESLKIAEDALLFGAKVLKKPPKGLEVNEAIAGILAAAGLTRQEAAQIVKVATPPPPKVEKTETQRMEALEKRVAGTIKRTLPYLEKLPDKVQGEIKAQIRANIFQGRPPIPVGEQTTKPSCEEISAVRLEKAPTPAELKKQAAAGARAEKLAARESKKAERETKKAARLTAAEKRAEERAAKAAARESKKAEREAKRDARTAPPEPPGPSKEDRAAAAYTSLIEESAKIQKLVEETKQRFAAEESSFKLHPLHAPIMGAKLAMDGHLLDLEELSPALYAKAKPVADLRDTEASDAIDLIETADARHTQRQKAEEAHRLEMESHEDAMRKAEKEALEREAAFQTTQFPPAPTKASQEVINRLEEIERLVAKMNEHADDLAGAIDDRDHKAATMHRDEMHTYKRKAQEELTEMTLEVDEHNPGDMELDQKARLLVIDAHKRSDDLSDTFNKKDWTPKEKRARKPRAKKAKAEPAPTMAAPPTEDAEKARIDREVAEGKAWDARLDAEQKLRPREIHAGASAHVIWDRAQEAEDQLRQNQVAQAEETIERASRELGNLIDIYTSVAKDADLSNEYEERIWKKVKNLHDDAETRYKKARDAVDAAKAALPAYEAKKRAFTMAQAGIQEPAPAAPPAPAAAEATAMTPEEEKAAMDRMMARIKGMVTAAVSESRKGNPGRPMSDREYERKIFGFDPGSYQKRTRNPDTDDVDYSAFEYGDDYTPRDERT
jgi:hypothetical protein